MSCIDGATLDFESAAREVLAGSPLGRLRPGERIVDLFCGAGGWTASPRLAGAGIRADYAVNHSACAIEWHAANNPGCVHVRGDAWKARPFDVMGSETLGVLLASAACTTHSNARGAAPISPRVHMLGWCIARWIKEKRPRIVEVENVPEWRKWGPLIPRRNAAGKIVRDAETGKIVRVPDKAREGAHFRKWIRYCRRQGYRVEFRVLDAADFGNASRRKRLFVKMRRDGLPIVWPEVMYGRSAAPGNQRGRDQRDQGAGALQVPDVRVLGRRVGSPQQDQPPEAAEPLEFLRADRADRTLHPHRCAADIIDWSDLGRSIFEGPRNKKSYGGTRLAKKTLGRACEGIGRFVLEDPKPFTLRVTHGEGRGWHVTDIGEPMATQTTRQDLAVVTPVVLPAGGPECGPASAASPLGTVLTRDHRGVASAVLVGAGGSAYAGKPAAVDGPMKTVTCEDHRGVAVPVMATVGWGEREGQSPRCQPIDEPLTTIPAGGGKSGVVAPVMIAQRNNAVGSSPLEPASAVCSSSAHQCMAAPVLTTFYGTGANAGSVEDPLRTVTTLDRHGMTTPIVDLGSGISDLGSRISDLGSRIGDPKSKVRDRAVEVGRLLKEFLGDRVTLNAEGMALAVVEGVEYVIVDILFRMLRPRELAAAMGFPPEYRFPSVQRDAVRLIGNAVAVPMAEALIFASLPGMRPLARVGVAA